VVALLRGGGAQRDQQVRLARPGVADQAARPSVPHPRSGGEPIDHPAQIEGFAVKSKYASVLVPGNRRRRSGRQSFACPDSCIPTLTNFARNQVGQRLSLRLDGARGEPLPLVGNRSGRHADSIAARCQCNSSTPINVLVPEAICRCTVRNPHPADRGPYTAVIQPQTKVERSKTIVATFAT
jgi:hypothetical protein